MQTRASSLGESSMRRIFEVFAQLGSSDSCSVFCRVAASVQRMVRRSRQFLGVEGSSPLTTRFCAPSAARSKLTLNL